MKKLLLPLLLLFSQISFAQWTPCNKGVYGGFVNAVYSSGSGAIFAATDGGIFSSTNNFQSWSPTSLTGTAAYCFLNSGSYLYAGTDYGVYSTSDGGISWKSTNLNYATVTSLILYKDFIYAATNNGVLRSSDQGFVWSQMNGGLLDTYVQSLAVCDNKLYAGTSSGIYCSTDDGFKWTKVKSNAFESPNVTSFAVSGSTIYVGTTNGIIVSTDGGNEWMLKNGGLLNKHINSVYAKESDAYVGTDNGVFHSYNKGEMWIASAEGLKNPHVRSVSSCGGVICAGTAGSGVFALGGQEWSTASEGMTNIIANCFLVKDSSIYTGLEGEGLFRSDNNGQYWNFTEVSGKTVNDFELINNKIFAATSDGVFASADGQVWEEKSVNLENKNARTLAFDGTNIFLGNDKLYVSTDLGESWLNVDLYKSISAIAIKGSRIIVCTDDGEGVTVSDNVCTSWTMKNEGLSNKIANCIKIQGDRIYLGTLDGLFVSTDNCDTWVDKSAGLGNKKIYSIDTYQDNVLVGTWGGMFLSTDKGETWKEVNDGLNYRAIRSIALKGQTVYVGTMGGGLYQAGVDELGMKIGVSEIEAKPALRVFPTPSADYLNIARENYSVPAEFNIFDALGSLVYTGTLDGSPLSRIDVSRLAPGAYCLQTGDMKATFMKK